MESLPDEIVLQILSFLEPQDVAQLQCVSQRFLTLARDNEFWKEACFDRSKLESRRQREQRLAVQASSLVALRQAMSTIPDSSTQTDSTGRSKSEDADVLDSAKRRAWTSWDPTYPQEKRDFYSEYVHRHAAVSIDWIHDALENKARSRVVLEATGMSIIPEESKIIAPLDDGGLCIWDVAPTDRNERNFMRSSPRLLPIANRGRSVILDIAAVDTVSVNSFWKRAYIATYAQLNEVDLQTLQVTGTSQFPGAISALSEARASTPMTVGTATTLHLFDFRARYSSLSSDSHTICELISGSYPPSFSSGSFSTRTRKSIVSLPQPGPASILHLPSHTGSDVSGNDIWVAGRFTSILNYDRRFWPQVRGTTFSGARLSSLIALPYPYVSRDLNLTRNPKATTAEVKAAKGADGSTLIAAGEYKGRGSLELYGLPSPKSDLLEDPNDMPKQQQHNAHYQNRQTAARSRLLSVSAHGASLVTSDGDGNLKWVERDGSTEIRTFNINDDAEATAEPESSVFRNDTSSGDIVQKILNHADDLLLWTGDGRIGLVEFGRRKPTPVDDLESQAEAAQEAAEAREERLYGQVMRRALEEQAKKQGSCRALVCAWVSGEEEQEEARHTVTLVSVIADRAQPRLAPLAEL